jgi:hypothetical protein
VGFVQRVRARRRYRRMARALAELDRVDRLHGLGAPVAAAPRRTRRPRIDLSAGVALVVVLTFLAVAVPRLVTPWFVTVPGSAVPAADALDPPLRADAGYPPLPVDSRYPRRVLPPVRPPAAGAHAFIETKPDGRPVGFDPCRPVHFVLNPDGMPEGGRQLLLEAVDEISDATGLAFVDDGVTTERLVQDRVAVQPQRYGERWAPVLIDWVEDREVAFVGEEIAGVASPRFIAPTGPGSERYVTGAVGLNRTWFAEALTDPGTAAVARGIVLHELAHLVGLDHVEDPNEVMHPTSETVGLGPGDRQGLAAVGAGDCHSDT